MVQSFTHSSVRGNTTRRRSAGATTVAAAALLALASIAAPSSSFEIVTPAAALNFGVIGDWGMGGYTVGWFPEVRSANGYNHACEMVKCNFTLSCGDNIYVANVMEGFQFSFERMFTSPGPFFGTAGNHDNVGPQIQYTKINPRWKFPSHTFTYTMPIDETGYTVQIFSVNTNDHSLNGGGQFVWLEDELKKSTARWKIIFGHFPTVGAGRHRREGSVGRIHALMEQYNAQAYFAGHDHIVDMNNVQGRVLGISGGMARGGMMLRGIAGGWHKFTLTQPSEYNKFIQDWPGHGHMIVRLSPNVMNIQVWDCYAAIQYDMSVTHDWIEKVKEQPESARQNWPSPEIVLAARKAEALLPKGPGGGVAFAPGGLEVAAGTPEPTVEGQTAAPTSPTTPYAGPTLAPVTVTQVISGNKDAINSDTANDADIGLHKYLQYSVTTECPSSKCKGGVPTINTPFTIFISGTTVSSASRIYLSSSPLGCADKSKPDVLEGTNVLSPTANVIEFTVKGASTAAYVCYSSNRGQTYSKLELATSFFGESAFVIAAEDGTLAGSATTTAAPTTTASPSQPTQKPSSGGPDYNGGGPAPQSSGFGTGTLVLVAILCIVGGVVGGVFVLKVQQQQQAQAQARGPPASP